MPLFGKASKVGIVRKVELQKNWIGSSQFSNSQRPDHIHFVLIDRVLFFFFSVLELETGDWKKGKTNGKAAVVVAKNEASKCAFHGDTLQIVRVESRATDVNQVGFEERVLEDRKDFRLRIGGKEHDGLDSQGFAIAVVELENELSQGRRIR